MNNDHSLSAVILAGGKSSRMKTNKALLDFDGKTMIEIVIERLQPYFQEIIIISNNPHQYDNLNLPIYSDIFLNRGPLAGIHTGLKNAKNSRAFFVACDMPLVDSRLALELIAKLDQYQAVVPQRENFLQPLHAAYRKDCLPAVEKALISDRSKITAFYDFVKVHYYDFTKHPEFDWDTIFFNVNTPADYQQAQGLKLVT